MFGGTSSTSGMAVHACRLLTVTEVSTAIGSPVSSVPTHVPSGVKQSVCLWTFNHQAPPPNSFVELTVSWNSRAVRNFQGLYRHGDQVGASMGGTTFATVVGGMETYVQTVPQPPNAGPQVVVSALRNGDVLAFAANNVSYATLEILVREAGAAL